MKPQLVDYDKLFKKKADLNPIEIPIKTNRPQINQIDNSYFFLNIFGLIIIVVCVILLYYRKKNKESNKRLYTQKVIQFYHDTNKFD